jgi:hypothetical protein
LESWSLWAIDGTSTSSPLEVEDFGTMSFLTREPGSSQCKIFGSQWKSGWEPSRGDGTYIVGQWYQMFDGRFLPSSSRPILYHRYLYSLENQRLKSMASNPRRKVEWFRSRDARVVVGPNPIN